MSHFGVESAETIAVFRGTELEWILSGVLVLKLELNDWLDSLMKISQTSLFNEQSLRDNRQKAISLFGSSHLAKSVSDKIRILSP